MKNTMRKKWIILITSFIIVVLLFVIYSDYMHFPRYTYKYITGGSREKTKEITKNIELIQELPYSNEVSGVSFIFSTNGHKVIGDISVKAIGKNSGFTYFNQTIDGKNIHNDELIDFFYNSDQNYGDESISVVISSTCDSEKGVMLLVTGDDSLPDHSLIVGDKLLPVDLVTQNIYLRNVDIYPWIIFSLFVIAIVVELAVIIWKKMDFKIFFRQTLISIIVTLLFIVYNSMVVSHRVLPNILENEQIFIRSYLFIFTLIYFSMFFYKIIGKEFIFRYRFVILFIVFILCVSMEITGSSVGMLLNYFPNDEQNVLFGVTRTIRSDEAVVTLPLMWSQYFDPEGHFSFYSSLIRGEKTDVFLMSGLPIASWLMIFRPFLIGFLFLPIAKGMSFFWCGRVLFLFMASFEFGLMINNDDRRLSLVYAILVVLSPFVQWWMGCVEMMMFMQISLVAFRKYLTGHRTDRIISGIIITICAVGYVVTMYPPWMIPLAYVLLFCAIWVFKDSYDKNAIIKISKTDIILIILFLIFMIATGIYIYVKSKDMIYAMSNTVYPGSRESTGGGSFDSFFHYVSSIWYAIFGYSPYLNTCEASHFLTLFPIQYITYAIYCFRNKRHDWLCTLMCTVTLLLCIYCSFGFPNILSKITMLNRSSGIRALGIFEFGCIILLIRVIAISKNKRIINNPILIFIIAVLLTLISIFIPYIANPIYFSGKMIAAEFLIFFVLFFGVFYHQNLWRKVWTVMIIFVSFISALLVNPVRKGVEDINSIEEMKIIREIVIKDPEAKWIVEGIGLPIINFPLMSGARTINSTNFYPDLGRWHMIDPNAEFEDVYNRYAHISITYFNEDKIRDKFILTSPDSFTVYLNYDELKKLDVKYIFSSNNFTDLDKFSLIIETAAYKIYKLN